MATLANGSDVKDVISAVSVNGASPRGQVDDSCSRHRQLKMSGLASLALLSEFATYESHPYPALSRLPTALTCSSILHSCAWAMYLTSLDLCLSFIFLTFATSQYLHHITVYIPVGSSRLVTDRDFIPFWRGSINPSFLHSSGSADSV